MPAAPRLEPLARRDATLDLWTTIGESYARTRTRPWDAVMEWVDAHLTPGGRVLDLATGNGRHAAALAGGHDVIAADFAEPLLRAAEARVPGRAVRADARELPFRDHAFDGVLFIAALHNIPRRQSRIGALTELRRVLRPGAPALVTVWNRWHPTRAPSFLMEAPYRLLGDGASEFGDMWVDWPVGDQRFARFYHFYSRRELREDLKAAGLAVERVWGVSIAKRYPDNLFATVRRP